MINEIVIIMQTPVGGKKMKIALNRYFMRLETLIRIYVKGIVNIRRLKNPH